MATLTCVGIFFFFYVAICLAIGSSEKKERREYNYLKISKEEVRVLKEEEKKERKIEERKKEAEMVVKEEEKKKSAHGRAPTRDTNGICSVCGFGKEGHAWPCIVYLMNMVSDGYQEKIGQCKSMLEDVCLGKQISKLRAEIMLASIKETEAIIKELARL